MSKTKEKKKNKKKKKSFISILFTSLIFAVILIPVICGLVFFAIAYLYKVELYRDVSLETKVTRIQEKDNYISDESIADCFLEAVVSIEDHRFYKHNGFDIISFTRAMFANIESGKYSQGGSTITQQLAKNLYLSSSKNIFRKAVEILIAMNLEKTYEKNEILELYSNVIYYGKDSFGVYDASYAFFNKSPKNLTHAEAAYLAGLTQSPTLYSSNENFALESRDLVLDAMVRNSNCIHNKK